MSSRKDLVLVGHSNSPCATPDDVWHDNQYSNTENSRHRDSHPVWSDCLYPRRESEAKCPRERIPQKGNGDKCLSDDLGAGILSGTNTDRSLLQGKYVQHGTNPVHMTVKGPLWPPGRNPSNRHRLHSKAMVVPSTCQLMSQRCSQVSSPLILSIQIRECPR